MFKVGLLVAAIFFMSSCTVIACLQVRGIYRIYQLQSYTDMGVETFTPVAIEPLSLYREGPGNNLLDSNYRYQVHYVSAQGHKYTQQIFLDHPTTLQEQPPLLRRVLANHSRYVTMRYELTKQVVLTSNLHQSLVILASSLLILILILIGCVKYRILSNTSSNYRRRY